MPWGPYRGRPIILVPHEYLVELTKRKHIDPDWIERAQDELVRRVLRRRKSKL